MNTKILIVEDHVIFREGLKRVIESMNGVELLAEAENGAQFLDLLKTKKPDIVLMDIKMPVMDGIEATEKAFMLYPKLKIIILTMMIMLQMDIEQILPILALHSFQKS